MSSTLRCVSCVGTCASPTCTVTSASVKLAAREHHAPESRARQFRQQLRMPGKMMSRAIHPFLADRRGHQRVDLAAHAPSARPSQCTHTRRRRPRCVGWPGRSARAEQIRQIDRPPIPFARRTAARPDATSRGARHRRECAPRGRAHRGQIADHNRALVRRAAQAGATALRITSGPMPAGSPMLIADERRRLSSAARSSS